MPCDSLDSMSGGGPELGIRQSTCHRAASTSVVDAYKYDFWIFCRGECSERSEDKSHPDNRARDGWNSYNQGQRSYDGMRVLVRLRNGVYNTAVIICNRACMIARLEAVMHMSSRETIRATYDALQRPRSPIAGFT
jgi:hypothetical protein